MTQTPSDTAFARDLARALADSMQIEFLEKVNAQLGLMSNPYGVMVAVLGVLFTIGAIIAAFVIWRQGAEYRKTIDQEVASYRAVAESLLGEKVKEFRKAFDDAIEKGMKELDAAKGEQKEALEAELASLKRRRDSLPHTVIATLDELVHPSLVAHLRDSAEGCKGLVAWPWAIEMGIWGERRTLASKRTTRPPERPAGSGGDPAPAALPQNRVQTRGDGLTVDASKWRPAASLACEGMPTSPRRSRPG